MDKHKEMRAYSLMAAGTVLIVFALLLFGFTVIHNFVMVHASPLPTVRDSSLRVESVVTGLNVPTSFAFLGQNDMLVLEKNTGTIQRIKNGILLPGPILDVNVATASERGMLGIDVIPIPTPILQPSSKLFDVYIYFTEAESVDGGTPIANRLYRYSFIDDPRFGPSEGRMFSPRLLLDLPVTPGPNHNGGTVVIGPDNNVYVIIGDLNRLTQAQNVETGPPPDGSGGILRVTRDGKTVDNGIIGNTHPINKYFAYGVRNSFGMDFDPVTNNLWDTENGPATNDEINIAAPGFNSGWRDLMGFAPPGFDFSNLVDFNGNGIYSDPEFVWTDTVAPTAIQFLDSVSLGTGYENDVFVGDVNNGRIYNFNLNSQRTALSLSGVLADRIADTDAETDSVIFGEGFGGVTDLRVGPGDGFLYVVSIGHGAIYRIIPN
jgi:glucose/arabinose dehydrogenase